jgi:hypothetical protein
MALGLPGPWYIKNISFDQSGELSELHIYIDFEKGFKFKSLLMIQ